MQVVPKALANLLYSLFVITKECFPDGRFSRYLDISPLIVETQTLAFQDFTTS